MTSGFWIGFERGIMMYYPLAKWLCEWCVDGRIIL